MADNTPVGSLSEFLAKRAAMKAGGDTPAQVTQAPTPQSESSSTPSKMAPPPQTATYAQKYKPSFLRTALGSVANEALGGSGHAGRFITGRIRGDHLVNSTATRVRTPSSATSEGVELSSAARPPSDVNIGIANNIRDIESQVIRVDKEVKDWGKFVTNEFAAVRKDIKGVLDVTKKTQADVDRMKKDLAEETFRKRVAEAKIRNKSGQLMSADQVQKNPYDVHGDQSSLAGALIKELEAWAAGGAIGVGGLAARKGITNLLRKKGGKVAAQEVATLAEKKALTAVEKKAVESMAARVGKTIISRKGGSIGTAIDILKTMKDDSQSGNHLRTWLRSKLGIEDPGEAAPWKGAMSNSDYDGAKKDADKTAKEEKEGEVKSDGDILISSKKDISLQSVLDIHIEARNELTLKARVITLDADRLVLKGGAKSADLGGTQGLFRGKYNSGYKSGSTEDQRFQQYAQQFGPDRARELMDTQENRPTSLGYWKNKIFGGGKDADTVRMDSVPNGTLADQRGKFMDEIKNTPGLYEKILRIAANEQGNNPNGTQAVIESMMNRALVRGTSLADQAKYVSEGGYYQNGNEGRGALEDPKFKKILEDSYKKAVGGSNISGYATDNASGGLAERDEATGHFRKTGGFNGETFFAPGTAEPRLASKWDRWHQNILDAQAATQTKSTMADNSGLRIKGGLNGQATAGGHTHPGTFAAARALQNAFGDNLDHFSSFDDAFHHHVPYHSAHRDGLAADFSVGKGMSSDDAAEQARKTFRAAGLVEGRDFTVRDEYSNPSGAATGGHIHFQFKNADAAQKFADYQSGVESKGGGDATPAPSQGPQASLGPSDNQAGRPNNMKGTVTLPDVGDFKSSTYKGGSGGYGGDTAIPYGTYPIGSPHAPGPTVRNYSGTDAQVFSVGFGEGNRNIPDPKLGRDRTDIQIHSDNDASKLLSAGCLAIDKEQYPQFLSHMKALIARDGPMVLRVSPSPPGQPHKFEIIPAAQATASRKGDKVSPDEAASNFKKSGDVNPDQADPMDPATMKAKDDAWFAGGKKQEDKSATPSKKGPDWTDWRDPNGNAPGGKVSLPGSQDEPKKQSWGSWVKSWFGSDDKTKDSDAAPYGTFEQEQVNDLQKAFKNADISNDQKAMGLDVPPKGGTIDQEDADSLEAAFKKVDQQKSDAEVAKTDFSQSVPVPNTSTPSGEDLTAQIKDQVDKEDAAKAPAPEAKANNTGSQGSNSGGNANEKIAVPRHHPESEAPRPGSDGYGDQQHNPDDCGICSLA